MNYSGCIYQLISLKITSKKAMPGHDRIDVNKLMSATQIGAINSSIAEIMFLNKLMLL